MKKKRKQSFKRNQKHSKKSNQKPVMDKLSNANSHNKPSIISIKPNINTYKSLTQLDDSINTTNSSSNEIVSLPNSNTLVRKSTSAFLLRRDSININDCLKPQWMQTTQSVFNSSFQKQPQSFQKLFFNTNYMFNLSNLKSSNSKRIVFKKKYKFKKSDRLRLFHHNSYLISSVNLEFIGLKFRFDQCKNWLLNSMDNELSCLHLNEFKTNILNFNHVNDLETEINELFIINLINLNHDKSLIWFDLLNNLKQICKPKLNPIELETIITDDTTNTVSSRTNSNKKPRPSYLIERDCHIFGGCVDDDALDEFFISSGAVYQSWPYVYEPGFQLVPLFKFEDTSFLLSHSDNHINYLFNEATDSNQQNQINCVASNSFDDELPSYSLDNFEINLFHVVNNKPKKHKSSKNRKKTTKTLKKKRVNQPVYNENNELIDSSSLYSIDSSNYLNSSSYTSDEDDSCSISSSMSASSDDSESFKAYKKRHELGLNNNLNNYMRSSIDEFTRAKCCSQMSLNELRETNLTDSSSFENYLYNFTRNKKASHHINNKVRLTNSCKNNDTNGLNFKMKRFFSQRDFWQINEENYFRHHNHNNNHQKHIEYSDQLVY